RHICPFVQKKTIFPPIQRYPQPRGQKKKKVVKYGMGGMIVMLLICIVWFPLLFMSLVKSVAGVVNPPLDVSFEITLAGFQKQLQEVSEKDFTNFALEWLGGYMPGDLVIAELKGSSNSLWTISPPSRDTLIDMLALDEDFPITVSWSVQRNLSLGAKAETASGKRVTNLPNDTKKALVLLLNGSSSQSHVNIFPRYIRAPSDSDAKPVEQLYKGSVLYFGNYTSTSCLNHLIQNHDDCLELYVFSDQDHGPVRVGGACHRQVCARVLQRHLAHHHVRGVAQHGRAGPGGGHVRQAHLPLPLPRDNDQVDPGKDAVSVSIFFFYLPAFS
uniref:Uncharacterized protein n=1 Tax=Hippocampus comes TaxID=109280 RepID=A0A3Q3DY68_HIPCM